MVLIAPVLGQGIPPYSYYLCHASDIAALGTILMSLAMTRFGPRIEPITSPTPGGCATSYATDAVSVVSEILPDKQTKNFIFQLIGLILNLPSSNKDLLRTQYG